MKNHKFYTAEILETYSCVIRDKIEKIILDAINTEPAKIVARLEKTTPLSTSQKKRALIYTRDTFIEKLSKSFKELNASDVLS